MPFAQTKKSMMELRPSNNAGVVFMIHKTTFQVKVDDDEVHVLLLDSVTVVFQT